MLCSTGHPVHLGGCSLAPWGLEEGISDEVLMLPWGAARPQPDVCGLITVPFIYSAGLSADKSVPVS